MNIHEYLEYLEYFFDTLISYLCGGKTRKGRPCLLAINELNHHQQKKEKPRNRRTIEDMA
jgi:hypothetical protein